MLSQDSLAVHAGRNGLTELGVHAVPIDLSTTAPLPSSTTADSPTSRWPPAARTWTGKARYISGCGIRPSPGSRRASPCSRLRRSRGVCHRHGRPERGAARRRRHRQEARGGVRPLYGGSDHLLASGVLGTEVTFTTPDGIRAALRPDTGLVILETPANPSLELVDIAAAVAAADGVPLLVDNTFATPVLQQPYRHGAAMVLHSATKFFGGHGDAMGGLVAVSPEWAVRLRQIRAITGGILTPWPAYLLHRGLATLPVRVRAQQASAEKVATSLAGHELIRRSTSRACPSAIPGAWSERRWRVPVRCWHLSWPVPNTPSASRLPSRMITHAVSLGGIDTLIQHPAGLTHRPVAAEAKPHAALLRLSVGLEDPADIVADLFQALEATR